MRVMSYNILHGGRDDRDERRWIVAAQVIRRADPDILLIQEACGFDGDGYRLLFESEDDLGMRGLLAVAPRTGRHTAVFVRPGVRLLRFDADSTHFRHAMARVTVAAPDFDRPVTVASIHLPRADSARRREEARLLAGLAASGGYVIVGGDTNGAALGDPSSVPNLLPSGRLWRSLSAGRATPTPMGDGEVLEYLRAAGFADAAAVLGEIARPTVPTAGFPAAERVPFRSDHLLLSPPLVTSLVGYRVIDDEDTNTASDHLPIVIDLDPGRLAC